MKRSSLLTLLLAGAVLALAACSPFQTLQASPDGSGPGDWLTFSGPNAIQVSDGVFIDMPDGPYRARFSDAQGVYYVATNSLKMRSWPGLSMHLEGGFHVRHGQPGQGYLWYGRHIGAPVIRLDVAVPVALHQPR